MKQKFYKYSKEGILLESYCQKKEIGFPVKSLSIVLDSGKEYKGFYWSRSDNYILPEGKFKQVDFSGKVLRSFRYVRDIMEYLGVKDKKNIYKAIREKTIYHGCYWIKENNGKVC